MLPANLPRSRYRFLLLSWFSILSPLVVMISQAQLDAPASSSGSAMGIANIACINALACLGKSMPRVERV
jgi:hypothetical protein